MDRKSFKEYMNESKTVNRWFILRIGLISGLAIAILTTVYLISIFY